MLHHYLKSFFINIRKNRFFYSINLVGFLTGFLLLTIIFTFVYQELSFDKFIKNAESIYRIHSGGYGVTPMCFGEQLNGQLPEIANVVRFNRTNLSLVHNNEEFPIDKCYYTDPGVFQMFSFELLSDDKSDVLKNPFSVVLNQSTARKLFGDHNPVGKTLPDTNGRIYTITGIMKDLPYNSHLVANAFVSVETLRQIGTESDFNCGSWQILTYVSLAESANKEDVEQKLNTLLENSRMGSHDGKIPLELEQLKEIYFDYANNKYDGSKHGNRQTVILYFAISILILTIVVINYINLSTAISVGRMKEFAIRKVNGARQFQIIKQNILETLGLIIASFVVAIGLIEIFLPQISRFLNLDIHESGNRIQLYGFLFVIILIIGFITGLLPGLFLSKVNETKALKNESAFKSKGLQRKLLLAFQLIIVSILLSSVFIVTKQISFLLDKDLGFNTKNVVTVRLNQSMADKNNLIRNTLLQNPQIKSVSFSDGITGDGFTKKPIQLNEIENLCYYYKIDPDYIDLYQMNLKYGRNFSWDTPTDFDGGSLVNEEFCKAFGIENPVNETFYGRTIVGVVKDFNFITLHQRIEPLIMACGKNGKTLQIKIASNNTEKTINFIRNNLSKISPNFTADVEFLDFHIKELYRAEINLRQSFRVYALVTLSISLIGLFGLTLFTIKKKTKETGIRKLHGASLMDTFVLLSKEQIIIVLLSNLIALPFSYWIMSKWLTNFDYHISIQSGVFIATLLVTLVFNLLAISLLLVKTHHTNPADVLKYE